MTDPIPMILHCPRCGLQHVDQVEPGWLNPPHRSHLCHGCGAIWRPADVATCGVAAIGSTGSADSWTPGKPTLRVIAMEQSQLVERLLSAVERAEADIGGEGAGDVLPLLGPINDHALDLLIPCRRRTI